MFTDPEIVLKHLKLTPGMTVADLGAGAGFYTLSAARTVGPQGHVYAVDVQKPMLQRIKRLAEEEHLGNVDVVWGDLEERGGTRLADKAVQTAVVAHVLYHINDRGQFVSEVARILVPGGRVLVVDWRDSFGGLGPPNERIITPDDARDVFREAGFEVGDDIDVGEHHYGFVAALPKE